MRKAAAAAAAHLRAVRPEAALAQRDAMIQELISSSESAAPAHAMLEQVGDPDHGTPTRG